MKLTNICLFILGLFIVSSCEQELINHKDPNRYKQPVFDSVQVTNDIYYRTAQSLTGNTEELFFDFHEPYGDSLNQRPLIILMHGGGFIQGKRRWMNSLAEMFPLYGYACANISYRLYDGNDFPLSNENFIKSFLLARQDLIAAINYFVYHASGKDPYRTDVNNIYVAGFSAGAIGALHAIPIRFNESISKNFSEFTSMMDGTESADWNNDPLVPVRGILSFAGAIFDTAWITPQYPDIFCVHGTFDRIVPFSDGHIQIANFITPFSAYGSEIIYNTALNQGLTAVLIPDEGAGHDNFFTKPEIWQDQAIHFLYSTLDTSRSP